MTFIPDDPSLWPYFRPTIIAHDVGRTIDRSTAVVGGNGPFRPPLVGIKEFNELPQGLYGSGRASALAEVDRRYGLTRNSSQTPSVPAIPCGPIFSIVEVPVDSRLTTKSSVVTPSSVTFTQVP